MALSTEAEFCLIFAIQSQDVRLQFNGRFGCTNCYHPGVSLPKGAGTTRAYPLIILFPKARTHNETIEYALSTLNSGVIKGPWPLYYNEGRENDTVSLSLITNATTIQTKERDNYGKGEVG